MDSKTPLIIVEKNPEIRKKLFHSLWYQVNKRLGICEQLRFIYDDVYTMPDSELKIRLTERLIDALSMGKKMGDRLDYYKKRYGEENPDSGNSGKNLIPLQNNRWRIRMRKSRKL
jgi:hypothetical protein